MCIVIHLELFADAVCYNENLLLCKYGYNASQIYIIIKIYVCMCNTSQRVSLIYKYLYVNLESSRVIDFFFFEKSNPYTKHSCTLYIRYIHTILFKPLLKQRYTYIYVETSN